ncbi:hypothetical protein BDZ97DRAFT_1764331 [Flammula alnicola]|nr:hypothetical protein BDZ97DRAFT_1764331 [Flammula alnicola]
MLDVLKVSENEDDTTLDLAEFLPAAPTNRGAKDMIDRMQMQYFCGRQGAITNKLVDIVTGLRLCLYLTSNQLLSVASLSIVNPYTLEQKGFWNTSGHAARHLTRTSHNVSNAQLFSHIGQCNNHLSNLSPVINKITMITGLAALTQKQQLSCASRCSQIRHTQGLVTARGSVPRVSVMGSRGAPEIGSEGGPAIESLGWPGNWFPGGPG